MTPDGTASCRCLTIDDDASFTAGDIAVHNSLLVSVFWPAWEWASNPALRYLCVSYDEALSIRDNRRCRDILRSEWYRGNWPCVELAGDQNAKTRYDTTAGGWRIGTSVGGRGLGEHPDRKIVDDPHKTKEAESDTERQHAIDFFDGTLSSRGKSRGARDVVIMQRLHEEDLSGHILGKPNASEWTHICLPMRFEPERMGKTPLGWADERTEDGELLWPDLFPEKAVAELESDMGSYLAAGQLQQRPSPMGGGMFKREWFRIVQAAPVQAARVRYWDKASTPTGTGARSAGALMSRTKAGLYYLEDVVKGRWSSGAREQIIKQTCQLDNLRHNGRVATWSEQEPGSGGKESAENTVRNLAGYDVHTDRVTGDKVTRARPLAAQAEAGNVYLVEGEWNAEFLEEICSFPTGKLKDQVDASSGAFNKLTAVVTVQDNYDF